jgi:hypothetical protein
MQKGATPTSNLPNGQKGGKVEGLRVGDFGPNGEKIDKTDIKLRIYLQPDINKP